MAVTAFPTAQDPSTVTDWSAVVVGFLIGVAAGVFAFALPVVGHVGARFVAGLIAGVLAGGGLGSAAWHGLLTGALAGLVVAGALAVLVG